MIDVSIREAHNGWIVYDNTLQQLYGGNNCHVFNTLGEVLSYIKKLSSGATLTIDNTSGTASDNINWDAFTLL